MCDHLLVFLTCNLPFYVCIKVDLKLKSDLSIWYLKLNCRTNRRSNSTPTPTYSLHINNGFYHQINFALKFNILKRKEIKLGKQQYRIVDKFIKDDLSM